MSDTVDTSEDTPEDNSSSEYLMTRGSILELLKLFYNNAISNNIYKVSDTSLSTIYKSAVNSAATIVIDDSSSDS